MLLYQYWAGEFMVLWFYNVQEHPKAQQAVILILKRLKRRGNGLKSNLTDWEKPGIKPAPLVCKTYVSAASYNSDDILQ